MPSLKRSALALYAHLGNNAEPTALLGSATPAPTVAALLAILQAPNQWFWPNKAGLGGRELGGGAARAPKHTRRWHSLPDVFRQLHALYTRDARHFVLHKCIMKQQLATCTSSA